MIKTGILGAAGYTAGELLRLLVYRPDVSVQWAHSQSQAGKAVSDIHTDLLGDTDLTFTDTPDFENIDLLFLCVGHGEAKKLYEAYQLQTFTRLKIIDLSQDFRLKGGHDFVYGLVELNKAAIAQAQYVANPGCFATCIQLALLPLADAHWLSDDLHVQAVTGSTGAGQQPTATTHFSWRNNNMSVYQAFTHRHEAEIWQSIRQLQPTYSGKLFFIPVRGNFSRGIFTTAYTRCTADLAAVKSQFRHFYRHAPMVQIAEQAIDLKQVVNTNKALIGLEKHGDTLLVTAAIDNLLKGASGQAVQNMNLLFGLPETTGLQLKGIGF